MIRIMTASKRNGTIVTVDGLVVGEYVETIDAVVKQAFGQGRPVHLYLRDVATIDEQGRALLARLASKGVHLRATGVYSSYLVAEINRSVLGAKAA